jgi:acetyltransferase-like isoleucine patch superfamily enzyme
MPVELNDKGTGNSVELHPWFEKFGRLRIDFSGNNNTVKIRAKPRDCNGMNIQLDNDSSVEIGETCGLSNTFIAGKNNCHVRIGDFTTLTTRVRFIMHEASRVDIGRDCMIASDVQFMTSDNHTMYDMASQRRINPPASIEIGDHVWIALQCFVMKGARIGNGAVIGLRSVVVNDIPENCLAVGAPARVVRTGVNWDRKLWAEQEIGG